MQRVNFNRLFEIHMNLSNEFTGDSLGTFVGVLFGCGSVAVTVLFGAYSGIMQIALVQGIGVDIAIYQI